mgnify:CR=1 FL=1|jgi:hypothetical protein
MTPQNKAKDGNNALVLDTIIVVLGLALIGTVTFNAVRLNELSHIAEANKAHLCWITETIFGKVSEDTHRACDELQGRILETWQAMP